MKKNFVTVLGLALLLVGVIGFFAPHFLGMHLTPFHNVVHLVSGALAVYFGTKGSLTGARTFCFAFGVIYGLLGIVGFIGGHADSRMFVVIPDHFELGLGDHLVHLAVAAVFIGVGAAIKPFATIDRP